MEVRKKALDSCHIINLINSRQLLWLGKIAKMELNQIPRKMLACWHTNKLKPGRPQLNMRNSYSNSIKIVIQHVPDDLALKKWLLIAEQKCWPNLIKKWMKNTESV